MDRRRFARVRAGGGGKLPAMKSTPTVILSVSLSFLAATSTEGQAPKPDPKTLADTGILERLAERSGVYGVPPTGKTPDFIADASWPQKLPNNWIIGQVGGLYVAPDDHVWIYQRPRTLTNDEAALTEATHKSKDGKPVDVLGFPRPYGALGDCCVPAPSVMEFDAAGKLLRAWGGPADPGKCRVEDGCIWPASEHGIFVDHNGFVYLGGNSRNDDPNGSAWSTTNGADGMILKFTKDGKFVTMIGGTGAKGPDSNNKDGGKNGTPMFFLPADITVDPVTNRMYVSDGYGNRRIVIVDAATGKYIGHFGAYGNNPIDDKAAADAGIWMNDFTKGNLKPGILPHPRPLREDREGRPPLRLRPRQQPRAGVQRPRSESRQGVQEPVRLSRQVRLREGAVRVGEDQWPARVGGVDELLDRRQSVVPLRRRQLQHDDLRAEARHAGRTRPPRAEAVVKRASSIGCTR